MKGANVQMRRLTVRDVVSSGMAAGTVVEVVGPFNVVFVVFVECDIYGVDVVVTKHSNALATS